MAELSEHHAALGEQLARDAVTRFINGHVRDCTFSA